MTLKKNITRREFIRLSTVATAGVVAAACSGGAQPDAAEKEAPVEEKAAPVVAEKVEEKKEEAPAAAKEEEKAMPDSQFNEAPMLADLVASGALPPVDERLPINPAVVPVQEGIGNYGGTFRRGFKGVSDRWGPSKVNDQGLTWYNPDLTVRPSMAESWEINEDASEWTLHLREGLKWSDGQPMDADHWTWWWENDVSNTTIRPGGYGRVSTGSPPQLAEFSAPDKYTLVFKFAHPKPLFGFDMTRGIGGADAAPHHYMAQFHIDTTDDMAALEQAAKDAGFETWDQYYVDRRWWYINPDRPVWGPWRAMNTLQEELFLMERNPYYWQVDAEGNQLPYVDKVNHRLFESNDVFDLWITQGEVDFQNRHVQLSNFTLYKESEDSGDYQVFVGTSAGHQAIQLNLNTKNERLREFFNIREVRQALSVAVDRQALIDIVQDGLGKARQYSPLSASPQYYEKQETAWIQFDPDLANQLLDDAGYAEKDSDGFRLFNDGSGDTLSFIFEGTSLPGTSGEDMAQLVVKYFADVGVKATYQGFERSLYTEHFEANEIEAAWWGGDRTVLPITAPWIFTAEMQDRPWAPAWGTFREDPGSPIAEEPPAGHWIWDIWALMDQINVEPDDATRNELFRQVLDIWAEELPMIGFIGENPALIIVKNGVKGYLPGMPIDDTTADEHLLVTATYYWDDPEAHM